MNTLKTAFLLTILTLLLVFIGSLFGKSGMVIALVLAIVMNFTSYWFSDKIVLAMYRGKRVDESTHPRLTGIVRRTAQKANLPMPKVYVLPIETPNAFATGRNPNHAAVAATEGILRLLDDEELEGVVSHELAHIRNRDILIGSVVATIAGAISVLANMAQWAAIFGGGGRDRDRGNVFVMLALAILAPIAALLIQTAISRSREYIADETGAKISRKPLALANALKKLHSYSHRIPFQANPATAHMFIVNPLTAGTFVTLFSTHPPLAERVKRLEELAHHI